MRDNSTRRYVFYRLQFFFYLALVLCTTIGVFFIQAKVGDPDVKVPLILLFSLMALLIGCVQLILQYAMLSRMLTPIQRLVQTLQENVDFSIENSDSIHIDQVRNSLKAIQEMTERSSLPVEEAQRLTLIMAKILTSLEKAWDQANAATTLVVMGNMCSQVAHDMRGPLQSIRVFLGNAPAYNDEKLEKFRQIALQSVMRLLQMADELLELRRTQEIQRSDFDLASLIKTICFEVAPQAQSRNVVVEYKGPNSLLFNGDFNKLGRVLQNLAQNSLQAMTGKSLTGNILFRVVEQESSIVLDVEDTGPGILPENREKMFSKPFTTKGEKGNGLGLMYCKEIVRLHGGDISVHDTLPHGATFKIELPLTPSLQ